MNLSSYYFWYYIIHIRSKYYLESSSAEAMKTFCIGEMDLCNIFSKVQMHQVDLEQNCLSGICYYFRDVFSV